MIDLPMMPSPEITPESATFWKAAADGKFLIGTCNACGEPHWYPRAICPFCTSADTSWRESAGRGKVYSCSLVSPSKNPFVIAFIALEEGPVLISNVFADDLTSVVIGQQVKIAFAPSERNMAIPVFVVSEN